MKFVLHLYGHSNRSHFRINTPKGGASYPATVRWIFTAGMPL